MIRRAISAIASRPLDWAQIVMLGVWQLATPAGVGMAVGTGQGVAVFGGCALVSTFVLMLGDEG